MKVGYITAGAAGMYCGSCMRDNTLAAALARQGVDVTLVPTYTPIRTDEESVAIDEVFFGGINVFLQQKSAFFRWLPRWADRILDSPRLINWATSRGIETSARLLGDLTLSMLQGEKGRQRKEVFRLADWLGAHVQPQVVNLTNILIGGCIPTIKRQLGCKIVVTLQGDDLFLNELVEPYKSRALEEIRRLGEEVDAYIVFSQYYADYMSDWLGLDRGRMRVVPLGLDASGFPSQRAPRPTNRAPTIGFFARICPAKGLHHLVDAFIQLKRKKGAERARLLAAGWLGGGDREYFERQTDALRRAGLLDAFEYRGVVDRREKVEFLQEIDVLCVPTEYREPKGLFALEAQACGVPVVLPAHGAFPEILAATGGVLVPPARPDALVEALHELLADPERARRMGAEAERIVRQDFSADAMARKTLDVYQELLGGARASVDHEGLPIPASVNP